MFRIIHYASQHASYDLAETETRQTTILVNYMVHLYFSRDKTV